MRTARGMAPDRSDLLQGTLDMLILKVLAAGPLHGYAIAQRIGAISRALFQVPQGSLYPALHRLENRQFLAATWARTESGRDAKVYRLTPKGRRHLQQEVADWQRLAEAIQLILQTT
ncbi:MAG TPA: PadR family transcriptional regulator [Vicinamibacterales bacterium]|nr:PadR family transcriptional regulator [Vicinamibacterales bacterium]